MADLRGTVTLIDFWTYSCINCQRSLPHVKAWDAAYRDAGLQVVGIQTPEFVFERDPANVQSGISRLGVTYPVAMDNGYAMWDAYRNQYWSAEFLVDATGTVRYFSLTDQTVTDPRTTHETYLTPLKIQNYVGDPLAADTAKTYSTAAPLPKDTLTLAGAWTAGDQEFTAGADSRIDLHYSAKKAYVVLGGDGTATVDIDGVGTRSFPVSGSPTLYPLIEEYQLRDATLHLHLTPGLQAYVFTFG